MVHFHCWIYDTKEDKIIDNVERATNEWRELYYVLSDEEWEVIKDNEEEGTKINETLYKKYMKFEYIYKETEKTGRRLNYLIKALKAELNGDIKSMGKEKALQSWRKRHEWGIGNCLRRALILWKSNPRRYKLKFGSFGIKRLDKEVNTYWIWDYDNKIEG